MKLEDLLPSFGRFREFLIGVRLCPDQIEDPEDKLSFNTLTLAISLLIFVLARDLVAGVNTDISANIAATVISTFIAFATGYAMVILYPNRQGLALARKWESFFVMTWLTSLIAAIVFDAAGRSNPQHRVSTILIDFFVIPGTFTEFQKDLVRSVLFSLLALAAVAIKTRRQDPAFSLLSTCSLAALAIGLAVNSLLMVLFLYGRLI